MTSVDPDPAILRSGHFEPGVTIHLYADRVVHIVYDEGIVLDVGTSRLTRQRIAEVIDRPYVVVGDMRPVAFIDREARAEFAGDHDGRVLASAVIVGKGDLMSLLARRWTTDNVIERPVAFFEDAPESLAWAHEQAAEFRQAGRLP